uniref:Non-specific protein-tyrosine kinase n=1 Tax=Acrobeloides nanus TaxID=290746 RepID=A0A914CJY1_9BILA
MNWHYLASTKSCYFLEFFVDYQRANESCAKRDSTLAIIPNEEVQNFIWALKDIDPVHSESGLIDTEGILIERVVNIDQKENLAVWLDGSKFGFNKFNGNNKIFTDAKCTHITMENTWKQLDCDVIMDIAVCEKRPQSENIFISEECPLDWHYFEETNSCYLVVRNFSMTWFDASNECKRKNGQLVSINSREENEFMGIISGLFRFWTGFYRNDIWPLNSTSGYVNWYNESSLLEENKNCIIMERDTNVNYHFWKNIECNETRAAICKMPASKANRLKGRCVVGYHFLEVTQRCHRNCKISQGLFNNGLYWLDSNCITKGVKIGGGSFGDVYKGQISLHSGTEIYEAAIKIPKNDHSFEGLINRCKDGIKENIQKEANIMLKVEHPFILPLYGISLVDNIVQIVTPYRNMGSLEGFLQKYKTIVEKEPTLLVTFCYQIATAMEHLARNNVIHGDLAARNVLVYENKEKIKDPKSNLIIPQGLNVQVADFGLATLFSGLNQEEKLIPDCLKSPPILWSAPEVLIYTKTKEPFRLKDKTPIPDEKTDIWSFGVTVWEMFSYGQSPYGNLLIGNINMENNDEISSSTARFFNSVQNKKLVNVNDNSTINETSSTDLEIHFGLP